MISKSQIKQAFYQHDINDDGMLTSDYLYQALLALNLPIELSDISDLFESVGREKEETVGLNDFMDIVTELIDVIEDNDIESSDTVFELLADPNVNHITLESLLNVCQSQNEGWTTQQIMEMLNEADLNHDGMIDLNEFKQICKKVGL